MIREVLSVLSPKDRAALGLVYLDDVERDEACLRLNLGEANFRVVLYRARLQFRRLIERRQRQRVA
jgi:DNA-directed RNA polymerase specialized sigma24 family protein